VKGKGNLLIYIDFNHLHGKTFSFFSSKLLIFQRLTIFFGWGLFNYQNNSNGWLQTIRLATFVYFICYQFWYLHRANPQN